MNRRRFLRGLLAVPVAIVAAPLVGRSLQFEDLDYGGEPFAAEWFPCWMDKDGTILKVDDNTYKGTFTWVYNFETHKHLKMPA